MYELIKASERCYYIDCPSRIGIIKIDDSSVALIDTGCDKDVGKKVLKIVQGEGWQVDRILVTHSHADHIGGNRIINERTGAKIFAPGIERDFTEHTLLEPIYLYGGFPPKELRCKFLLAEGCEALPLNEEALPDGVSVIPLPGHSFDMVGYLCDGVAFIADALCSPVTLEKYGIGVIYDVKAYLSTLDSLKSIDATTFVPSHADVTKSIEEVSIINRDAVLKTADKILEICRIPTDFDTLMTALFNYYGITMTIQQYALVGSAVRSYIAYLQGEGTLGTVIENNRMLWATV